MATTRRELSYGSVQIYYDEVLGIGSYGKVCKAKCGQLPCAAKLLHDTLFQDNDPGTHNLVSKFLQECKFLSTIKHPNIVQYLGTVRNPQSQRAVLLMELMDESLTRFLERLTGPLPYHSQLNTCHDVALALAYLHSNDIIHRDLSSNNVLLIGEGRRAKVTDFGMSKLMDMNPRMTPLTQVPGTPAYMPPEAFIRPPRYSSKLDCFSHGVLTLQIITRNFPNPGDAGRYMDDPRYPTGRVLVHFPETERRKKDIDLIEPTHSLLPSALQCLMDRDTERPSADELCGRLASLKRGPRYKHSVEQTRGHVQRLQEEISRKDGELERGRAELERKKAELQTANEETRKNINELERARVELERRGAEIRRANEKISRKNDELERGRAELERERAELDRKDGELERRGAELRRANERVETLERELQRNVSVHQVQGACGVDEQLSSPMKLTWRQGQSAPKDMDSISGAVAAHGSTAYFSSDYDVYSYTVARNRWTKLPKCKYCRFALAVINNKPTTIGGLQEGATNSLLSFSRRSWKEALPPMPTERHSPAAVTTHTHLVVAGGHTPQPLSKVEVLNTKTLQWSTASSLPAAVNSPGMTTCCGHIYLNTSGADLFTCTVEDLLESTTSSGGGSVWTRLAGLPLLWSTLATLRGCVLAIGGRDSGTGAIHCYDVVTNSWAIISDMPTPRFCVLAAVLPNNELVVVGGGPPYGKCCEICSCW